MWGGEPPAPAVSLLPSSGHVALHLPCGLGRPGGPTGTWCLCCVPGDHGGSGVLSPHACCPRVHTASCTSAATGSQHGRVSTPGWAQTLGDQGWERGPQGHALTWHWVRRPQGPVATTGFLSQDFPLLVFGSPWWPPPIPHRTPFCPTLAAGTGAAQMPGPEQLLCGPRRRLCRSPAVGAKTPHKAAPTPPVVVTGRCIRKPQPESSAPERWLDSAPKQPPALPPGVQE